MNPDSCGRAQKNNHGKKKDIAPDEYSFLYVLSIGLGMKRRKASPHSLDEHTKRKRTRNLLIVAFALRLTLSYTIVELVGRNNNFSSGHSLYYMDDEE